MVSVIIIITTFFAILFLSANQYPRFYDEFISISNPVTLCLVEVSASQSSRKCSMSSVVFALHISQFIYPSDSVSSFDVKFQGSCSCSE